MEGEFARTPTDPEQPPPATRQSLSPTAQGCAPADAARDASGTARAFEHRGAACWRQIGAELIRLRLLSCLDLLTFECYCDAYSHWREAIRELADVPITDPGYRRLAVAARKWGQQLLRFGSELGCSPVARQRLNVNPNAGSNKFAGLIPGREA